MKLHLEFNIDSDFDADSTIASILELIGNGATAGETLDGFVIWSTTNYDDVGF